MPSNAGLNRVGSNGGKVILTATATADSGAQMLEAKGFSNWVFQLQGTFTNFSVELYGTVDADTAAGTTSNWFQLPAPSTESTGDATQWKNPLVAVGDALYCKVPLVAVRAVATGTSPTGTCKVLCFALE